VREARAVRGDFLVELDASVHSLDSVGERSGVDGRPAFEKTPNARNTAKSCSPTMRASSDMFV
jgi:hypothetical protein